MVGQRYLYELIYVTCDCQTFSTTFLHSFYIFSKTRHTFILTLHD